MAKSKEIGSIEDDEDDTGNLGGMLVGMPERVKRSRALPKEGIQIKKPALRRIKPMGMMVR